MRSPWSCVLWDVDGTIADASEGILRRLNTVLTEFGRTPPQRAELSRWIGPPMYESFQKNSALSVAEADVAIVRYRQLAAHEGYETGIELYPGVADIIRELHAGGIPQSTASSKPETQVIGVLDRFDMLDQFDAVVGAAPDEKSHGTKEEVIAEALRRLDAAGADTSRPVLIGDRHHDVEGAQASGTPVIFVTWGFSWPHESEGARAVVDDAAALRALLVAEDEGV